MLDIPLILRLRRRRQTLHPVEGRSRLAGYAASLAATLLLLGGIFAIILFYNFLWSDLPSLENLPALLDSPDGQLLQPTTLYDRSGQQVIAILENPAAHGRQYMLLKGTAADSLPLDLVNATLAASDPAFWQHSGYNLTDLHPESHPTLAQKLVYDLLLVEEPADLRRSLRERLLAGQATARFGQEKILEWYLNSTRYGDLIYGADAAARVYFGKSASQLSLAEAAALAAIGQLPEINPYQAQRVILERRNQILLTMQAQKWISASQQQQASQQTLTFVPPVTVDQPAPAFVELALSQIETFLPRQRLERGGWRIITTLDYELQTQVNCTMTTLITRYFQADGTESSSEVACPAARLLPTLTLKAAPDSVGVQSAVIVLDPHTGQVLSLAGSLLQEDPTHAPDRPSGTLSLPFLYLNTFSHGFSPGTLAWDIPPATSVVSSTTTTTMYHGPVRLRTALANDYLAPASQLIDQFGLETSLTTARQLGALTETNNGEAVPAQPELDLLGRYLSQPAGLFGMAQAYATLDNRGLAVGQMIRSSANEQTGSLQPYAVLRLENHQRQVWLDWSKPVERAVLSPQLAHLLNHSLSDEVARWNSLGHPNPFELGRPAAAKLGQTSEQQDAWAFGYTPQRLVGVWLGTPGPIPSKNIPTSAAAALWHAVIQYALRNLPAEGWPTPLGISEVQVCDPSGLLPTIYCPLTVNEVFLTGSEPTQADNLYRLFQINRETGRLATVFTPPELVEEKVFLIVPPEARSWATEAGLPTPPEDYDVLSAPPQVNPEVNLSSPAMFSHVRGQVTLKGSAEGAGFQFFRLNFGQGLNPQLWLQIGSDTDQPVKAGTLGVWDTQGLNGLYALQLQVVRLDQRVETALIQVTVDNIAPEITLVTPTVEAVYLLASQPNIVLNARASDNLELAQVVFYIEGQQVASLAEPPYIVSWPARLGKYTLKAIASDLAGNQSVSQVTFIVK